MLAGLALNALWDWASPMALFIMTLPLGVWTLGLIFILGGIYVAIEEMLEDSLCAGDESLRVWRRRCVSQL